MIKAGREKDSAIGSVIIEGRTNELMNEFRAICGGIRGMLADDFGEEKGNKVFDILSSNKSEDESVKEVEDVLYGDVSGKIDENKFSKE